MPDPSLLLLLLACTTGDGTKPDSPGRDSATSPTPTDSGPTTSDDSAPTDSPTGPDTADDDGDGFSEAQGDCDDANPNRNPGASDADCTGFDHDCDGVVNTGCVWVGVHEYARWIIGASDINWYEAGVRWRTEEGDVVCTAVSSYQLRDADPCPGCDFAWQADRVSESASGVACETLYVHNLGTDMVDYDQGAPRWDDWGYAAAWTGPSQLGYVVDAPTVLTYWSGGGAWVGWAYEGMSTADWYAVDEGDQRSLGFERSYSYNYAYVYVPYIFP